MELILANEDDSVRNNALVLIAAGAVSRGVCVGVWKEGRGRWVWICCLRIFGVRDVSECIGMV